jgi:hypothetical protein
MRNLLSWLTAAAFGFLAAQACDDSGGGSDPNAAAGQADLAALCDAICARGSQCEAPDPEEGPCEPSCLSEGPEAGLVRRDIIRGLVDCQQQVPCDESDDACFDQVVLGLVPDALDSPLLQRCLAVHDECGGFSDDSCSYTVTFTDVGKARLEACLSSGCAQVGGCIAGLSQGT